ncbi:hypothetical protein KJ835_04790, partial [Patescibacteria group bacterium]|nr:hypothetical protein [Patescibacteria group bacterium]
MHKSCGQCKQSFEIANEDLKFYDKVSPIYNDKKYLLPPPTLCPDCRQRRRLVWRGERKLYSRKCDLCGKNIISIFATNRGYTVYCPPCYWSDKWNPADFGRSYDPSRTFFEQYDDLLKSVPLQSSYLIEAVNSEFNNNASYLKNCYLMSSSNSNEDCYYGYFVNDSRDCMDCTSVNKSEKCYESIECVSCYDCRYCKNCVNCTESYFLTNCISCNNCFGSINLRHKKYCFFNEQLTKNEYEKKISTFLSGDRTKVEEMLQKVREHNLKYPFPYMIGENNENVSGNSIYRSKNSNTCFDCDDIEDCKYCYQLMNAKDCYDIMSWGRTGELFYECVATGANGYNNSFTAINVAGINNLYSYMCMHSKNLFGCVSVKKSQYMILNKKYSPAEFETLAATIIENMIRTKEWGEFFPEALSPFTYNESLADDFFPLTKDQAEAIGAKWYDETNKASEQNSKKIIPVAIQTVTEDILKTILTCQSCQKNYKIIPQELDFYKKNTVPLPINCVDCRHKAR